LKGNCVFKFEDELTINGIGSKLNLDASYKESDTSIYFEAKCHELFENHYLRWKK